MKRILYSFIGIAILTGLLAAPGVKADADGWQTIVPGIDYQAYTFASPDPGHAGPVKAYVARMDIHNPNVILDSASANGAISGSRQNVSDLAALYDDAINYWGQSWGQRNNVVVAINGGFFDMTSGVIQGGQVQGGWYAKRFGDFGSDGGGGSGFAWKLDRSFFMGQCVYHITTKQYVTYLRGSPPPTQPLDDLNLNPNDRLPDRLVMYTPQYNETTPSDSQNALELTVELTAPALIKPQPGYVSGKVTAVNDGHGGTLIPYDSVVISAAGVARNALIHNAVQIGDEVRITQEITNCADLPSVDWTKTYASIDGNKILLNNGMVPTDLPVLGSAPRTAIAFNDDYIFFIVVDGRQPGVSIGLDLKFLGQFALDTLGANWAINQDGGGSSTMVINGQVVNTPSDHCNSVYLPLVLKTGGAAQVNAPWYTPLASQAQILYCPRSVANGMLMVQLESPLRSTRFAAGNDVVTNQAAVLRVGPGSNYAAITTLPAGAVGAILPDNNNLAGIMAKGSYRWKVDFGGGNVGWVAEETLDNQ